MGALDKIHHTIISGSFVSVVGKRDIISRMSQIISNMHSVFDIAIRIAIQHPEYAQGLFVQIQAKERDAEAEASSVSMTTALVESCPIEIEEVI